MELELRKSKGKKIRFLLSGVKPAFVNSLRRTMIQEIPIMAIDEVEIIANDSVMSDETLAHRLGQLPIKTPEGYLLPSECDCREGRCSNCTVTLTLEDEGPGAIKAKKMKPSDPKATPVQEEAPIVRLGENQKISFTAIARLGKGKKHNNWQPAVASYKYMPIININQDAREDWTPCIEACPQDILKEKNGNLKVTNIEKCTLCEACEEACPESIEVKGDPTKFIFNVETTGSLSPKQTIIKALETLEKKCDEFTTKLEKVKQYQ